MALLTMPHLPLDGAKMRTRADEVLLHAPSLQPLHRTLRLHPILPSLRRRLLLRLRCPPPVHPSPPPPPA